MQRQDPSNGDASIGGGAAGGSSRRRRRGRRWRVGTNGVVSEPVANDPAPEVGAEGKRPPDTIVVEAAAPHAELPPTSEVVDPLETQPAAPPEVPAATPT